MGDPGGGSDFAGFYNHLGIPIAEWGFGGPAGTYHSAYDTFAWMERFGDPGFLYHATAARVGLAASTERSAVCTRASCTGKFWKKVPLSPAGFSPAALN